MRVRLISPIRLCAKKSLHRRLGRQNRKRAAALAGVGQFEDEVVAADQYIGLASQRELQKHLIIRISALRQTGLCGQIVADQRHQRPIRVKHPLSTDLIQPELFVACDSLQFGQRAVVGQTEDGAGFYGLQEWCERWRGKVKQIHDHVGVKHQACCCPGQGHV